MTEGTSRVFSFSENSERAFACRDAPERSAVVDPTRPEVVVAEMPELLAKWGLQHMELRSFSYTGGDGAVPKGRQTAEAIAAAFFSDPVVLKALRVGDGRGNLLTVQEALRRARGAVPIDVDAVAAAAPGLTSLRCSCTSLTPLRRLLHAPDLIRNPPPFPKNSDAAQDSWIKDRFLVSRQADVFLPCGITISDALREYVMLPDDTFSENATRLADDELGAAEDGDVDVSSSRSAALVSPALREELLFHVFRRLVSGGGPLCQSEDDAAVYALAARQLYKDLVAAAKRPGAAGDIAIVSQAFAVGAVALEDGAGNKGTVPLFPVSDDVSDSNCNFAYLIVNPTRREVVWWYNACWSSF